MKLRFLAALAAAVVCVLAAGCAGRPVRVAGRVPAADGTEIAWERRGEGAPAIVLIHCWCGNREFWRNQFDLLAKDHAVYALDLPGHGASGRTRAEWSVAGLGHDVARFCRDLDVGRVVLVGHSMGGPVALHAAAELGDQVVGIVAVDTLHDCEHGMTKEQVESFAKGFDADFEGAMRGAVASMLPKDVDPRLSDWITRSALATDRRAATALMRDFANQDLVQLFESVHVPIRGINSASSPWPTNVEANRRHADYDAVVMSGVGHYPHLERPAEFDALLLRTLDELQRRAKP